MPTFFLLLSALCLVDDSAAVGLHHVWTRDQIMSFWIFQVVLGVNPDVYPVFSWLLQVDSWTSATSQAMDRSRRHHFCSSHCMSHRTELICVVENPRKWCPVFHLVAEQPGY